ncbi:MAG: histidine phosphatase family protein, partial [Planctomycetota bacterium]|nr:histidine phosphatase family protein [Planctomycetota bacterium]
ARGVGYEPTILDSLAEIDRGHWEGHEAAEIKRRWGKLHKQWYDDPAGLAMPGGEAFDDLWDRAGAALDRIASDGGDSVLVCAHKAINRVLIARLLGRPTKGVWAIPQPQAGLSELIFDGGAWRAESIGDVEHLPDGMRSET